MWTTPAGRGGRPTDCVQGLRQCPPRTPRSLLAFPERFQNRPNQLAEKTTDPRANPGQIRLCAHGRCRARTCDLLLVRRVRRLPLVAVSCCYLTNLAFSRRLRARQLPLVATACFQIVSRSLAVAPPESGTAYAGSGRRAA